MFSSFSFAAQWRPSRFSRSAPHLKTSISISFMPSELEGKLHSSSYSFARKSKKQKVKVFYFLFTTFEMLFISYFSAFCILKFSSSYLNLAKCRAQEIFQLWHSFILSFFSCLIALERIVMSDRLATLHVSSAYCSHFFFINMLDANHQYSAVENLFPIKSINFAPNTAMSRVTYIVELVV